MNRRKTVGAVWVGEERRKPRDEYVGKDGRHRTCRLTPEHVETFMDDPMTRAYGVDMSEFLSSWRKKDLADGCPFCLQDMVDNA